MKSGHGGFSLVEVMITIVVVGILAAVATPVIMTTVPRYRLRAETNELILNFKRARAEAIKRNRDVVISFVDAPAGQDGGTYQIFVNVDGDAAPRTFDPPTDIELANRQIRASLRLTNTFTNNQTGYDPRGLPIIEPPVPPLPPAPVDQNVTLAVGDDEWRRVISPTLAGNVRLTDEKKN